MTRIPCYIPSYMRAGNVLTLDTIPAFFEPILVVHQSEKARYRKRHPGVRVIATQKRGIGLTRAFICRHALGHNYDVVAMLDDDINGWIYKEKLDKFGGIRQATTAERDKRWRIQIARAQNVLVDQIGYAISFTYRFALAGATVEYTSGVKLRVGLVNECMLMNRVAMENAQFTLDTCEDIEATLHWLEIGCIAGQDQRLGHTSPKTSLSAKTGGCGEYREQTDGFHLRNHRKLWKMFPDFVAKPKDEGKRRSDGMVMLKTRVGYAKAAKTGGMI